MKVLVIDITNDGYPVAIADDEKIGLEIAKQYVREMFKAYDESTLKIQKHFPKDIRELDLIGINISSVDYNSISMKDVRTNYFFRYIKRDGTVLNKNEVPYE